MYLALTEAVSVAGPALTIMEAVTAGAQGRLPPGHVIGFARGCRFTIAVFITAERFLDLFVFWLPLYHEVTVCTPLRSHSACAYMTAPT